MFFLPGTESNATSYCCLRTRKRCLYAMSYWRYILKSPQMIQYWCPSTSSSMTQINAEKTFTGTTYFYCRNHVYLKYYSDHTLSKLKPLTEKCLTTKLLLYLIPKHKFHYFLLSFSDFHYHHLPGGTTFGGNSMNSILQMNINKRLVWSKWI